MNDDAKRLVRLQAVQEVQALLAGGSLDDDLDSHAELARRLVGAASCSVMLLNSDTPGDLRMRLCASAGDMPAGAAEALVASGEGICGRVLASGRALLVEDIARSEFAALARRKRAAMPALVSAPIRIDGRIAGVLNLSGSHFCEDELRLLEVMALFIGKSIQVQQLRRLLDSRFAQMALLQEAQLAKERVGASVRLAYRHPEDVARILARSFFREMTKAGFESAQIVGAATELIGQLNQHLQQR